MPPIITTARLRLRLRTLDDVEANLAMDLDPRVFHFLRGEAPDRDTHRADLVQRIEQGWPPVGGIWVVEWRERPGFLGWCGLFPLEDSGLIEIGYRYATAAWSQGVATEAAKAVLDHGFRVLRFDPIVAVVHPDNRSSQRVIEKIGLKPRGTALHYGRELKYYRLDAAAYVAGSA